jgi:hypothetical protein
MVVGKPVAMPRPKNFGGITGIDRVCGYNFVYFKHSELGTLN